MNEDMIFIIPGFEGYGDVKAKQQFLKRSKRFVQEDSL
jgi:hypothetical protein